MKLAKALLILLVSLSSIACQAKNLEDMVEISNDWIALSMTIYFNGKKYMERGFKGVVLYHADEPLSFTRLNQELVIGSAELLAPVWSTTTENPFRHLYGDIYQNVTSDDYDDCDFTGVQFELDDSSKTKEWYIAFNGEVCAYGNNAIPTAPSFEHLHGWIIQRDEKNHYRVLMEGDDTFFVTTKNTRHGYKAIETDVIISHLHRKAHQRELSLSPDELEQLTDVHCGRGKVYWEYQGDQYQPVRMAAIGSCDPRYKRDSESDDEFFRRMKPSVTKHLLDWVSKVTEKPMQMDEQGYLSPQ